MRRRDFLRAAAGISLAGWSVSSIRAAESGMTDSFPEPITISGTPAERGRSYGTMFRDDIHGFLQREIYGAFITDAVPRDELFQFAGGCAAEVERYSPEIFAELTGVAKGAAVDLEEVVLISLHEELYHRGVLPKVPHCTAVAVGPPHTQDGSTYVGQTWDWMASVYGTSRVLRWQRDGTDLLASGCPGMWTGAGLTGAGIALCWTSASLGDQAQGVRVGIPSYALLTHLLYQDSIEAVADEARRATNAGWFTFVMADGNGNLLNVEGSPERGVVVEPAQGLLHRVGYGSREMTRTPADRPVPFHGRCAKFAELVTADSGSIDGARLQHYFEDASCGINVGPGTIDMMVFDCTSRTASLSRGPAYNVDWKSWTVESHG